MKIDNRYEIRVVLLEVRDGIGKHNSIGDVYDNYEEFKKNHPFSSYKFGFTVFDTESGCVPDGCNEWNDSPEDAMFDYVENCLPAETVVDRMRKAGYPLKIKGNDGYEATLVGCQPLCDGDFMGIYRYPGGECCHDLDEIKRCCEVIEQ